MAKEELKGIPFFNLKSGETLYAKTDPQIQAFINSSDIGINASRGQDFKWRLAPEWVKKVKAFRRDEVKMERIADKNGGKAASTAQILYAIYGAQVRAARDYASENEDKFADQYQEEISENPVTTKK